MSTNLKLTSDTTNRVVMLKKRIIQCLIGGGDATIADLGRELNLSTPTVAKFVGELQDDGYVVDFGKIETSGGRRPNIYGLNPASGYFIGVDIQRDRLHIAAIDFKGDKVKADDRIPYRMANTQESLSELCEQINTFIDDLSIDRSNILAIGVNVPGRVNPSSGYSYSNFFFDEKPLAQTLEERLHSKVYIENDSRAMTYGEYMRGVVTGEKNILFVNLSWGLGIGIIIDGNLYYGKSGLSGEMGHFCIYDNEILCHCGKKGCMETEISGSAFLRILSERYHEGSNTILADKLDRGEEITIFDLVDAVHKEDVLCIEILESMSVKLGKNIAGMMNIFNPDVVILGGTLSQFDEYISLPVQSSIRKYSLNLVNQDTDIKISRLGERAGALGACLLSRSKLLGVIRC